MDFTIDHDDDEVEGEDIVYKPQGRPEPVEDLDPESLDAFVNQSKARDDDIPTEEPINYEEKEPGYEQEPPSWGRPSQPPQEERPSDGYSSIAEEKADLLNRLQRLSKKGFHTNKRTNIDTPIEDLRTEYKRITYSIEVENSIKFSRRALMACVTGLEFLNKRYDPFELSLDGWSETMYGQISDYDSVFEDLYHKYHTKVAVAPEIKLMMMVGGSAMMFHLSSTMFKSAQNLNMGDILQSNPGLMSDIMKAAQGTGGAASAGDTPSGAGPASTRREMKPPSMSIGNILGGNLGPPPPVSGRPERGMQEIEEDDAISDMDFSETATDELTKDIEIKAPTKRRGGRKKSNKNEVTL